MNGTPPRIEIFAPFGAAWELMMKILFRPFDLSKWLVIGFAAFLSGGFGSGLSYNPGFSGHDWQTRARATHFGGAEHMPVWLLPLIFVGCGVGLLFILLLIWVVSRGRFIFTDCVVRNRGAIAEPWREYRREGNSYFLFTLVLAFIAIVLAAIVFFAIALPLGVFSSSGRTEASAGVAAGMLFLICGLIWLVISLYLSVVTHIMVPIMYRRRCTAMDAFGDAARLVLQNLGSFILFVLFGIVLMIALGLAGTLIACVTCCIGALPYISTVLLLPGYVTLRAFVLLFLRQFGPDYDVWAGAPPLGPAEPPLQPPLQPPPPPSEPPPLAV